jgi:hypothetical protein
MGAVASVRALTPSPLPAGEVYRPGNGVDLVNKPFGVPEDRLPECGDAWIGINEPEVADDSIACELERDARAAGKWLDE